MIRFILKIAVPAALFLGLLGFVYTIWLPRLAVQELRAAMFASGFKDIKLGEPQSSGRDYILYENLQLDADGISTIDTLAVKYSLTGLILGGQFERIQIQGLSLTGETHADSASFVALSGWNSQDLFETLQSLPARELNIKGGRIALLTEDFSGVSLGFDGQVTRHDGVADVQVNIGSAQKNLSFTLNITGRIQEHTASLEFELERGKVEWDRWQLKASRISGRATHIHDGEGHENDTDLQIGGLNFLGMPWQSVGASIENNERYFKLIAGGKSVGLEGLELGVDVEHVIGKEPALSAFVHFETMENFLNYYYTNEFSDLPEEKWQAAKRAKGLTAYFVGFSDKTQPGKLNIVAKLEHPALKSPESRNLTLDFTKEIDVHELFDPLLDKQTILDLATQHHDSP